jgi:hypothetical protein
MPPGFYSDGEGVLRFWDGQQWTTATRPMPQTRQHVPRRAQQPKQKRGVLKWIAFGIVIALLVIGLVSVAAQDEDTAATRPTGISEASSGVPSPQESGVPSDEPSPQESQLTSDEPSLEKSEVLTYGIGDKATDGAYQFIVTKITCGISRVGSESLGEKAQGQFCLVKLRVRNVGDGPIIISEENQTLVDRKGRGYLADDEAWPHVGGGELPFREINPGNTLRITVPYDIPKKAKPDYLLLKADVWGLSDGVRVKL